MVLHLNCDVQCKVPNFHLNPGTLAGVVKNNVELKMENFAVVTHKAQEIYQLYQELMKNTHNLDNIPVILCV
jgi:hypothetical protein